MAISLVVVRAQVPRSRRAWHRSIQAARVSAAPWAAVSRRTCLGAARPIPSRQRRGRAPRRGVSAWPHRRRRTASAHSRSVGKPRFGELGSMGPIDPGTPARSCRDSDRVASGLFSTQRARPRGVVDVQRLTRRRRQAASLPLPRHERCLPRGSARPARHIPWPPPVGLVSTGQNDRIPDRSASTARSGSNTAFRFRPGRPGQSPEPIGRHHLCRLVEAGHESARPAGSTLPMSSRGSDPSPTLSTGSAPPPAPCAWRIGSGAAYGGRARVNSILYVR